MLKIGLTGGIGAGKTLVSDLFAELGVPVIDADRIAHELTAAPDSPACRAIRATFGDHLFLPDGQLDRRRLRNEVFADPERLAQLEAILHPLIRERIERQTRELEQQGHPYCVIAIPLLIEADMLDLVDRVVVVDIAEAAQIERVMARDHCSREAVGQILARQASRGERLAKADHVIDNSGSREATRRQVLALHRDFRGDADHSHC